MEKRKASHGRKQKKQPYKTPEIHDLNLKRIHGEGATVSSTTAPATHGTSPGV